MNIIKLFFCLAIALLFNACTTEVLSEENHSSSSGGNSSGSSKNGSGFILLR